MKKKDLIRAYDTIQPSEAQKERMLDNIINNNNKSRNKFNLRLFYPKAVAAALVLIVFVAAGVFAYNNIPFSNPAIDEALTGGDSDLNGGREDFVAPMLDQFKIGNKNYYFLSDDLKTAFGLPQSIKEEDIGDKIATITDSVDKNLIGREVYAYKPAGGEAIVAVKKDDKYILFYFMSFDSYNENKDEDAVEYLKLYGINGAGDISKILFIKYTEEAKLKGESGEKVEVTDRAAIEKFYNFYSVLKDSSDKYFDKLFKHRQNFGEKAESTVSVDISADLLPPDYPKRESQPAITPNTGAQYGQDTPIQGGNTPMTDEGATSPSYGIGSGPLANAVAIRIYNQKGVYFETFYYPEFGFISRYEVSSEFADFLSSLIK